MSLNYDEIVDLVGTIDDCCLMDEDGFSRIEVVSMTDRSLQISRSLKAGKLTVTLDSFSGKIEYVSSHRNTSSCTMGREIVEALKINTEHSLDSQLDAVKDKIREIIKVDIKNSRSMATANN